MRGVSLLLFTAVLACGNGSGCPGSCDSNAGTDASDGRQDSAVGQDSAGGDTDFAQLGPFSVTSTTATIGASCTMSYVLYEPSSGSALPLVVLGHGFARSSAQMVEVAEYIASHGARVATPDFCTISDHAQNGADARALSQELAGGQPVVHAGYSAGGLAAVVAASGDSGAVAVLGLDLVDSDGLAASTATSMQLPFFGMAGEAGDCNSSNNGVAVFDGPARQAVRINGAGHCDFEGPTNALCETFCGSAAGALPIVKTLAAAFVAWQAGLDDSGEGWVTANGVELGQLVSTGTIEVL